MKKRDFYVVVEQGEDGYYVGEVPQLKGCYSQGLTLEELMGICERSFAWSWSKQRTVPMSATGFVGVHRILV